MKEKFITVTGINNYCGAVPFRTGALVSFRKEPENRIDSEAIRCSAPVYGTVGYVANSVGTVAGGTMSAGRIYDKVTSKFYARVLFVTGNEVICRIEDGEPFELEKELLKGYDDEVTDIDGDL